MKERLPRHVETSVFPSGDFGRFSHRLPIVSLFIDVSTSCLFARRIPSMESYPFLSEIS